MKPLICAVLILLLGGCDGKEPRYGAEGVPLDQLKFTDKSCLVLEYFIIPNALCSDGEVYVYDKYQERYHHVQLQMAVY